MAQALYSRPFAAEPVSHSPLPDERYVIQIDEDEKLDLEKRQAQRYAAEQLATIEL